MHPAAEIEGILHQTMRTSDVQTWYNIASTLATPHLSKNGFDLFPYQPLSQLSRRRDQLSP